MTNNIPQQNIALEGSETDETDCDDDLTCGDTDSDFGIWYSHVDQDGIHVCTREVCDVIDQRFGCDDEEFTTAHKNFQVCPRCDWTSKRCSWFPSCRGSRLHVRCRDQATTWNQCQRQPQGSWNSRTGGGQTYQFVSRRGKSAAPTPKTDTGPRAAVENFEQEATQRGEHAQLWWWSLVKRMSKTNAQEETDVPRSSGTHTAAMMFGQGTCDW